MKTAVTAKGALLPAFWLAIGFIVLGFLVHFLLGPFWGFLTAIAGILAGFLFCRLRAFGYTVELRGREFVITRGFFWRSVVKIPVRYISSTGKFTTPLSRMLGTGVLSVTSSGRLTIVVGLPVEDISALRRLLTERQV